MPYWVKYATNSLENSKMRFCEGRGSSRARGAPYAVSPTVMSRIGGSRTPLIVRSGATGGGNSIATEHLAGINLAAIGFPQFSQITLEIWGKESLINSGGTKIIDHGDGRSTGVSPALQAVFTNIDTGESLTFGVTGTFHTTGVTTVATGHNLLADFLPDPPELSLTIGHVIIDTRRARPSGRGDKAPKEFARHRVRGSGNFVGDA